MKFLLGHKIGMTQLWNDKGKLVGVTVIHAAPNTVIQDGEQTLAALAVPGKARKPQAKMAAKAGAKRGLWLKVAAGLEGETATVAQFEVGDKIKITGTTKGKGFAGTIKRHNFRRGPVSHGSDNVRAPGAIGAQRPQRVPKGKKMAGHMGHAQLTVRGSKVVKIDVAENLIVVSGAVPGPKKSRVIITEL